MYIRWKKRDTFFGTLHTVYLAENKRVDGKPKQTGRYLAGINSQYLEDAAALDRFWNVVLAKIKDEPDAEKYKQAIEASLQYRVGMEQVRYGCSRRKKKTVVPKTNM